MNQNSLGSADNLRTDESEIVAAKHRAARKKYRLMTVCISVVLAVAICCLLFTQCGKHYKEVSTGLKDGVSTGTSAEATQKMPIQTDWSDWQDDLPDFVSHDLYAIEEQTFYRSRNLERTSSTTQNAMDGWELYDTIQGTGQFGNWTDWSSEAVSASDTREVETQTRYRYRDKETTTDPTSTMSGWELYDTTYSWGEYGSWSDWSTSSASNSESRMVETKTQYRYRDIWYSTEYTGWSSWSSWQDGAVYADNLTQVETRTVYEYGYFYCPNCGNHWHGHGFTCFTWGGGCGNAIIPESTWVSVWGTTPQSQMNWQDWHGTGHVYAYYNGERVFRNKYGDKSKTQYRYSTRSTQQVANYGSWSGWGDTAYSNSSTREVESRTVYRYCDRRQTPTYHFWRWGNWSDWSANAVSDSDNRQIETMPYYRYRDKVMVTTYYFMRWSDWTDYSSDYINESETVDVETKTQYRYKPK